MSPRTRTFLLALLVVLPLDQATKALVVRRFGYGEELTVIPGLLDLTHVRNPGGAFSFFADGASEWRAPFFIGASVLAIGLLGFYFWRLERDERLSALALGLVLGGALGNLIDRLVHGEVIDFINVHLTRSYTWPTFNVADSAIVVGVGLLVAESFLAPRHAQAPPGDEPATAPPPARDGGALRPAASDPSRPGD